MDFDKRTNGIVNEVENTKLEDGYKEALYLYMQGLYGRGSSENTLKSYKIDLKDFLNYLRVGAVELKSISRDDIREYILYLSEIKSYSNSTIRRKLSSVKGFIKHLEREGVLRKDPLVMLKGPKLRKKLPVFLYEKEVKELLSGLDTSSYKGLLERTIIELLYVSGMRVSELINLERERFSYERGEAMLRGKGGHERVIFIGEQTVELLKSYAEKRRTKVYSSNKVFEGDKDAKEDKDAKSAYFFIKSNGKKVSAHYIWRVIKDLGNKQKIGKNLYPHALRHSYATHILGRGGDLRIVQELLGHKSLSSTEKYTHITKEKLKERYKMYHPHA